MSGRTFPLVADRLRAIEAQRGPLPEAQRAAALAVGRNAEVLGEAWVAAEPGRRRPGGAPARGVSEGGASRAHAT